MDMVSDTIKISHGGTEKFVLILVLNGHGLRCCPVERKDETVKGLNPCS